MIVYVTYAYPNFPVFHLYRWYKDDEMVFVSENFFLEDEYND